MFDVKEIFEPFTMSHDSEHSRQPHLERSTKLDSKMEETAHLCFLKELEGQLATDSFPENRKMKQHWEPALEMPSFIQPNSGPLVIQNASRDTHVTHSRRWIYANRDVFSKPVLERHGLYTTPISKLGECHLRESGELNRRR